MPISRAARIAIEIADALTRAHYLGIIHRDLKPANILIAPDGSARLTDFGVAYLGERDRVTRGGNHHRHA
ncbi:MAG: protein kinase [Chloroflexi bacterium]|nr:protein kinase [Chloroflexota bacterium]